MLMTFSLFLTFPTYVNRPNAPMAAKLTEISLAA